MKSIINYKTFADLQPVERRDGSFQARMKFDNGYEVSVVASSYNTQGGTFELAILKNDKICYDTHITNDVIRCDTQDEITFNMALIQELQPDFELLNLPIKPPILRLV